GSVAADTQCVRHCALSAQKQRKNNAMHRSAWHLSTTELRLYGAYAACQRKRGFSLRSRNQCEQICAEYPLYPVTIRAADKSLRKGCRFRTDVLQPVTLFQVIQDGFF